MVEKPEFEAEEEGLEEELASMHVSAMLDALVPGLGLVVEIANMETPIPQPQAGPGRPMTRGR